MPEIIDAIRPLVGKIVKAWVPLAVAVSCLAACKVGLGPVLLLWLAVGIYLFGLAVQARCCAAVAVVGSCQWLATRAFELATFVL